MYFSKVKAATNDSIFQPVRCQKGSFLMSERRRPVTPLLLSLLQMTSVSGKCTLRLTRAHWVKWKLWAVFERLKESISLQYIDHLLLTCWYQTRLKPCVICLFFMLSRCVWFTDTLHWQNCKINLFFKSFEDDGGGYLWIESYFRMFLFRGTKYGKRNGNCWLTTTREGTTLLHCCTPCTSCESILKFAVPDLHKFGTGLQVWPQSTPSSFPA